MKPLPSPTPCSEPYWQAAREGKLIIQKCSRCGSLQLPPRPVCGACWSDSLQWQVASGLGKVLSATVVHQAPSEAFAAPYVLALVQVDEGPQLMANVLAEDPNAVRIEARVRLTFEQRGDFAIPQFVLASR